MRTNLFLLINHNNLQDSRDCQPFVQLSLLKNYSVSIVLLLYDIPDMP
nr:MAG TPA: hypothetical protein [Caudoviricetes sp.]